MLTSHIRKLERLFISCHSQQRIKSDRLTNTKTAIAHSSLAETPESTSAR
ncbi:hypothetical protein [Nostoc sp. NMS4]|nr:hypothetical protein [Nostoc sp. NMS4]MBN3923782.1 hypothetical protein [Nostoc sp. NMS4]